MVTSNVEVATEEEALSGNGGIYGIDEARLFRELEQGEWKGTSLSQRSLFPFSKLTFLFSVFPPQIPLSSDSSNES